MPPVGSKAVALELDTATDDVAAARNPRPDGAICAVADDANRKAIKAGILRQGFVMRFAFAADCSILKFHGVSDSAI